ncbi:hypothetical protein KDA_39520 [Dictyobacter alpinus]|uniref:UspA domain-containing protein n=1 Tax=Dictyobacter alpinus TaxID=2014873 RepID=A0A402BAN2_9CHLR|nr:hypothetical protein [Dictyobacter alpinus]GCE28468.1 hypothetical protein KDA_39520 [Dictyobacter alpinus]
MRRLLLPFTHGIDGNAIDFALAMAQQERAILVVISWLTLPITASGSCSGSGKHVRLGFIEQSQDFLALIQHKARRFQVPIECIELYSTDVVKSMMAMAGEMDCDALLLFQRNHKTVLLDERELKQLLVTSRIPLLFVQMSAGPRFWHAITARLGCWVKRIRSPQKVAAIQVNEHLSHV